MCLADDVAFTIAFDGNIERTGFMVRTILGRNDLRIVSVRAEAAMKNPYGHSVRLDILARSDEGALIDIEMQRAFHGWGDLSKRMAAYGSMLGARAFKMGEMYRDADEIIVIFILDDDVAGRGEPRYVYRMMDVKDHTEMEGSNLTFVVANGSYRDNIESVESLFYRDLYERDIGKMRCPEMRAGLEDVKGGEEMIERTYGELIQRTMEIFKDEWDKQAEQKGVIKDKRNIAMRMLKSNKYPISEIATIVDLPQKEVEKMASKLGL